MTPHPREHVTTLLAVDESSQVGSARRCVAELTAQLGFSEETRARAGIIATELANNLLRHAREARLLVRIRAEDPQPSLEMLAVDAGPGMADPDRCLRDGYSTGGTAGQGLGAVQRLSQEFDLVSLEGAGTVVLSRIREPAVAAARAPLRLGVVCLPLPGEDECGDTWAWRDEPEGGSLLVFDGLGHGPLAASAARAAYEAFHAGPVQDPVETLQMLHHAVAGSRGGAAAVARIDRRAGRLRYAGIGNIGGVLLGQDARRGLASHNGIMGSVVGRPQGFEYDWAEGDMLVMHSDGIQSRWTLERTPGITTRDPALAAAVLYRDFARGRDDLTVAVVGG